MELLNAIIRGLTSLREGQQETLSESIEVSTLAQLPSSVKAESSLKVEIEVQSVGSEFVINFENMELTINAPCNTCGHRLKRRVNCQSEYLAVSCDQVSSGDLDLKDHIKDILLSSVGETLPCLDDPCEWREDVDRFLGRNLKQKASNAFHPFQDLLSEKKLKQSHQEP
jgi:hypothetical protein